MNKLIIAPILVAAFAFAAPCPAQEIPEMPKPQKEHKWLERLVGEWETNTEINMEPGQPPIKCQGTETTRMLGGFWTNSSVKGDLMGMPMEAAMTLGYDSTKKKYVGTWVDSMTDYLWNYTGTVDESGDTLTLETKGPCPKRPGELANFKEVMEFQDDDNRTFTSSIQEKDGTWTKMVTVKYKRKK